MKFKLKIEYLGKRENKHEAEKDMYHLTFKTYNAEITGKIEDKRKNSNYKSKDDSPKKQRIKKDQPKTSNTVKKDNSK